MTSDDPQTSSNVMEDKANEPGQTRTPSSNSEAFAELSRLARESTSSWSKNAPGRKTDRAFLLLIVIAIILLSGITMIASYREQISDKFDDLTARTSQHDILARETEHLSPEWPGGGNGSVKTLAPSSAELENKVKSLEQRLAQLQSRFEQLETGTPTPDIATPVSTPVSTVVLDSELPEQEPEPIQPEQEPEPGQTPSDTSTPTDKTSESAISLTTETMDENTLITTAPVEPPVASPDPAPALSVEPKPAVSKTTGTDQVTERGSSPEPLSETNNWYINLAAYSQRASAKPLFERTQQIATADIQEVISGTRTVYRVRAIGYPSAEEARTDARRLEALLGLTGTWISNK